MFRSELSAPDWVVPVSGVKVPDDGAFMLIELNVTGKLRIRRGFLWYSTSSIQDREGLRAGSGGKGTDPCPAVSAGIAGATFRGLPLT